MRPASWLLVAAALVGCCCCLVVAKSAKRKFDGDFEFAEENFLQKIKLISSLKNRNKSHVSVRTGTGYRKTNFGTEHTVEHIIMHPHFETQNKDNDIALIKLAEPIHFNDKQQPIELAKPHDIPREGELMRISGFGKIGEHINRKTGVLKAAYVPVINQEYCKRAYESVEPITDNMFCAGNGDADACYGDSGGPGVIHGKLYGIISTGKRCELETLPGVYTRMYKYHDWIEEETGLRF